MTLLTYNFQSISKLNRRTKLTNTLNSFDQDIVCITESWLTLGILNNALFLTKYQVCRSDRQLSTDNETKHGEVFIAIENKIPHEKGQTNLNHQDSTTIKLSIKGKEIRLCCVYDAPFPSQYKWNASDFIFFNEKINQNAIELDCKNAIITVDLNFSQTNWNQKPIKPF